MLGLSVSSFLLRRRHSCKEIGGADLRVTFLTVPAAAGGMGLALGATLHFAMLALVPWAICACMLLVVSIRAWKCCNCIVTDDGGSGDAIPSRRVRFSGDVKVDTGKREAVDAKV